VSEPQNRTEPGSKRRLWRFFGALAVTLLVAISTAIGTGLGASALDLLHPNAEPISHSAHEEGHGCEVDLFVNGDRAAVFAAASDPVPAANDWQSFRRANQTAVADVSIVDVSIQGESPRVITITGVDFTVDRRPRPAGAKFDLPCGDALRGRFMQVDLDRSPPALLESAKDPDVRAGSRPSEPILFPWTVSITDPLLLKIIATTERCYCVWRARIMWRSGSKSGVMHVDNDGKGYSVVGSKGAQEFGLDQFGRWARTVRR